MTNGIRQSLNPTDLEYLGLEQAAAICSVSDERFAKWIEKGAVPVIDIKGKKLIRAHDLIQHLIRHNIPIPDRLLQGNTRKILFILAEEDLPDSVTAEVIWALYRLKKRTSFIVDFARHDQQVELKIITFSPDIICLLQKNRVDHDAAEAIRTMHNGAIPVYAFATDREINLDVLLGD